MSISMSFQETEAISNIQLYVGFDSVQNFVSLTSTSWVLYRQSSLLAKREVARAMAITETGSVLWICT